MSGIVKTVRENSVAARAGIVPGDQVLAIDGQPLQDLIDYRFLSAEETMELCVSGLSGDRVIEIQRAPGEDLGIELESPVFDGVRECNNKCAFCFVDQAPPGMRPSTLIHDDDYRLSFLCGNFVTLTNLSAADLERILRLRLSPLYVSVHATDPRVRARLFRSPNHQAGLDNLRRLAEFGIELHCQVVLCPGINDGEQFERTVGDLAALWPSVRSVGVVPVGLTDHRAGLPPMQPVLANDASRALASVHAMQVEFLGRLRTRFAFGADELYLRAGLDLPETVQYEDFPQTENGVGLCRPFFDQLVQELSRMRQNSSRRAFVVTGMAAAPLFVRAFHDAFGAAPSRRTGCIYTVVAVENRFFGKSVDVAGLLAGRDILCSLARLDVRDATVLLPGVALSQEMLFIDSMPLAELRDKLRARVVGAQSPADIRKALEGCTNPQPA